MGLEFDAEPLLLIVLSRDLIGIPTLLQQADCRLGQHGSRGCAQGVKRVSGDGETFGQEGAGTVGEGLTELRESPKTVALQPRPFPLEPHLSAILVAPVRDNLNRFFGHGGVGGLGPGDAAGIRSICHDVQDFFVRHVEVLEQDQSKHDPPLHGHGIDDGSDLLNGQE